MRIHDGSLVFSATDLVNFLGCRHATYLDRRNLDEPMPVAQDDPMLVLLQQKGIEHERGYLQLLRAEGRGVVEIPGDGAVLDRVARTREAMEAGADVIYQGALLHGRWHGYADFLVRVDEPSALGAYRYEPADTKLAHTAKPKHALQLYVYAKLLENVQGVLPHHMHVVLGEKDKPPATIRTSEVQYYFRMALERFEAFVDHMPKSSIAEPCNHCDQCRWRDRCEAEWERADHLSFVAQITRSQRGKLETAGVVTMAALATLDPTAKIGNIQRETLKRLVSQAKLQVGKRTDGQNRFELLEVEAGRGFGRLPAPNSGDLFFDMEGDPLFDGGLEYLFGFLHRPDGGEVFTPFWGHDRDGEKQAFERAMDYIVAQLTKYPEAHVYHYAQYEESALKRLAMIHGTREDQVDSLLRGEKLVDLYQLAREAIRVSEPGYSIKNLETFYMPARVGEVKLAATSVVVYERWRQLGEARMLQEICDYNEADCRSTLLLRDWLLSLRPSSTPWFLGTSEEAPDPDKVAKRQEAERRATNTRDRLLNAPTSARPYRELVGQLLEFHRREAKPAWWFMFKRQELAEDELIDDAECIGGLRRDPTTAVQTVKRSSVHTFKFPPQDFKLRVGDRPLRSATLEPAGEIVLLDEEAGKVALKIGPKATPLEDAFSLIPSGPIDAGVLREAVYRFAEAVITGSGQYLALESIVRRERPKVKDLESGRPIAPDGADVLKSAVNAISRLDRSHMLVQGPPGTGKTYLSAHAVVRLLSEGRRVGVASNSHKAINNLLTEIEKQALAQHVTFRGVKKSSAEDQEHRGSMIVNVTQNEDVSAGGYQLIAGTAWLFARPEFDQTLDTLFIDEAGQVSLANVVAMGVSAKNIVLVGDQMQLAQPIQGDHPGESGQSALEFVLGDWATVPPDRGIFLPISRRMHPDVCGFISQAVYEGRLQPALGNASRQLILGNGADPSLRASGIRFVLVEHEGCSQKSEEEGARVLAIYTSLLTQRWTDGSAGVRPLGVSDILVVSPYNVQVNHLKTILPIGARVGTVDKFQGQEAAVVLVSMTTSTAEDMPRGIEFLYSRNRLNVAISRAQSFAIVVASPQLLEAPCNRLEQLRLVNTLCFAKAYADNIR